MKYSGTIKERIRMEILILTLNHETVPQESLQGLPNYVLTLVNLEEINKDNLSRAVKDLSCDNLIKVTPVPRKGRGSNYGNGLTLIKSHKVLIKVVNEIYELTDSKLKELCQNIFIRSKFAEDLINTNLVNKVELDLQRIISEEDNSIKFEFTNKEKELMLRIIKMSPSALHYLTRRDYKKFIIGYIKPFKKHIGYVETGKQTFSSFQTDKITLKNNEQFNMGLKDEIFMNLQVQIGEDVQKRIVKDAVNYKVSLTFLDGKSSRTLHNQVRLEENKLEMEISNLDKGKP